MQNTTQIAAASPPAVAAGLSRLLTPDTKIAVGAWLLCMTGILALINPSDLPASAFFKYRVICGASMVFTSALKIGGAHFTRVLQCSFR